MSRLEKVLSKLRPVDGMTDQQVSFVYKIAVWHVVEMANEYYSTWSKCRS